MTLKPNKIEYGGNVLIDLTNDNVVADALVEGYTAHNAAGEQIPGTNPYEKIATDSEINIQASKIAELSTILDGKAAGGGGSVEIENGLVITSMTDDGRIETADWYGETVPSFRYAWYYESVYPTLTAKTKVITLSDAAFQNAWVSFADGFFDSLLYAGSYALAMARTDNTSLNLPVFTGYNSAAKTSAKDSLFRINYAGLQGYYLPCVEIIGNFWWYQKSFNNGVVQLGSVGHPVLAVDQRPFGSASGSATITVYTKGELLDTISTAMMNLAGTGLTFIFKASEDTTYNDTSYAVGETMVETTT